MRIEADAREQNEERAEGEEWERLREQVAPAGLVADESHAARAVEATVRDDRERRPSTSSQGIQRIQW